MMVAHGIKITPPNRENDNNITAPITNRNNISHGNRHRNNRNMNKVINNMLFDHVDLSGNETPINDLNARYA